MTEFKGQHAEVGVDDQGSFQFTEAHWKVINFVRAYHREFETAPTMRKVCQETGLSACEVLELFPSGLDGACKVAGVSKPTGCV